MSDDQVRKRFEGLGPHEGIEPAGDPVVVIKMPEPRPAKIQAPEYDSLEFVPSGSFGLDAAMLANQQGTVSVKAAPGVQIAPGQLVAADADGCCIPWTGGGAEIAGRAVGKKEVDMETGVETWMVRLS